jgi:hypothetical protein
MKRVRRLRRRAVTAGMVALLIGGIIGGIIGGFFGAARSSSKIDELKKEMTQLEAKMLRSPPEEGPGC